MSTRPVYRNLCVLLLNGQPLVYLTHTERDDDDQAKSPLILDVPDKPVRGIHYVCLRINDMQNIVVCFRAGLGYVRETINHWKE